MILAARHQHTDFLTFPYSYTIYIKIMVGRKRNWRGGLVEKSQLGNVSMGQYMANKVRKLREQNEGILQQSMLFHGIVIYVNGYTTPSKEELRQLIVQHGGQFEAYQTSKITHMIATHIPDTKLREFK